MTNNSLIRHIVRLDYVDYGVNGEYGFFGKTVAHSDVRGMSAAEMLEEARDMRAMLGNHVVVVEVFEVPAIA